VALTTVSVASKTATALASTTELAANAVARKTASVALNTATVATQTANLAATKTSQISETAGGAVAATATTVVDGISHLSLAASNTSPKSVPIKATPSRRFFTETSSLDGGGVTPSIVSKDSSQGLSYTPEAFSLGTSTLPEVEEETVSGMKSVRMRLWAMLGATDETARRQWVANVTSSKPSPPSAKYLRKILTMAWETRGDTVDEFYKVIPSRPIGIDALCALKALITSLRLVREGPPEALRISIDHLKIIDAIGAKWAERVLVVNDDPPVSATAPSANNKKDDEDEQLHEQLLIARLSALIVQKLHFHSSAPQYTAQYALVPAAAAPADALSRTDDDAWERKFEVASALLTLLGTIEGVTRLALGVRSDRELAPQPAALALAAVLTEEAAGAYDALSAVVTALKNEPRGDGDLVKSLIRRTHEAYQGLRLYFDFAQSFVYIAALRPATALVDRPPQTKSDILNALAREEAIQDKLGRSDLRLAESTEQGLDVPAADASTATTMEDEDGEDAPHAVPAQTTANPFDTGNSAIILLAEATNAVETAGISNPFLSGMSTYASVLPGRSGSMRNGGAPPSRKSNATAKALDQCVRSFQFSGIMLSEKDVAVSGDVIGRGAFSVVYRGKLASSGADVAVKELQLEEWGRSPEMVLDFRAEVALMKAVHHPNVLQLIGAQTQPSLRLVSEFCSRGNLLDLLYVDMQARPEQSKTLTWPLRLRLALGEARGMAFLHTAFPAPLIHRDLKSPNLLLSKHWTLKVSDFGLSRFMGRTGGTGPCGTTQWMAPEVIEGKPYDETADCYSFGVNLWELATRRIPWENETPEAVKEKVVQGLRLDVTAVETGCPPGLVRLMEQCWSQDPTSRPNFPAIVRVLKALQEFEEL